MSGGAAAAAAYTAAVGPSAPRPCPDLAERLGDAVDYLEAHLQDAASLDQAARRAGFSRWHFMRVFQAASGFPAAEYLRRRRLSRAAEALAEGRGVLEVALDWGYGSQATFTRAFVRAFRVTPAAHRRAVRGQGGADAALELTPPFEPRLPWAPAPPPPPRRADRPASRWIGLGTRAPVRRFRSYLDLPAFWTDFLRNARWRPLCVALGLPEAEVACHGLVRVHASGEVEYVIGQEVPPGTRAPRGYLAVDLPAAPHAVFTAVGEPSRTAQELALSAYARWLPGAGVRRRPGGWDLELYFPDRTAPPGAMRCELWIPLAR